VPIVGNVHHIVGNVHHIHFIALVCNGRKKNVLRLLTLSYSLVLVAILGTKEDSGFIVTVIIKNIYKLQICSLFSIFFGLPQYYLGMKLFITLIMHTHNVNYIRVY